MAVNPQGPGALDNVGFAQGFISALTDVDTVARDLLGVIRRELNGFYKYVQFGASRTTNVTASMAAGDVACYVISAGSLDIDRLTLVDEPNSVLGAGVVMAAIPSTGGPYFGWLQVCGTTTLNQAIGGTTPAAGNEVTTTGASAKTVTKRAAVTDMAIGILVDNNVSATPVVNINFPF